MTPKTEESEGRVDIDRNPYRRFAAQLMDWFEDSLTTLHPDLQNHPYAKEHTTFFHGEDYYSMEDELEHLLREFVVDRVIGSNPMETRR